MAASLPQSCTYAWPSMVPDAIAVLDEHLQISHMLRLLTMPCLSVEAVSVGVCIDLRFSFSEWHSRRG